MDLRYFGFLRGLSMRTPRFDALFDGPARVAESPLTERHHDVAASIQHVTEVIVARMVAYAVERYGIRNVALAGGVALNCVANGKLLADGVVDELWVQPAAGMPGEPSVRPWQHRRVGSTWPVGTGGRSQRARSTSRPWWQT